jgi:hypothetical protein
MTRSLVLFTVLGWLWPATASGQHEATADSSMRLIALAHFHSLTEAHGGSIVRLSKGGLRVERLEALERGPMLFRIYPHNAHETPVILAALGDTIVRLGGFVAPELFRLSLLEEPLHGDSLQIARTSARYARLADSGGAHDVTECPPPSHRKLPPVVVHQTPEGWWSAVVIQCARPHQASPLTHFRYAFRFSSTGELIAWSRAESSR